MQFVFYMKTITDSISSTVFDESSKPCAIQWRLEYVALQAPVCYLIIRLAGWTYVQIVLDAQFRSTSVDFWQALTGQNFPRNSTSFGVFVSATNPADPNVGYWCTYMQYPNDGLIHELQINTSTTSTNHSLLGLALALIPLSQLLPRAVSTRQVPQDEHHGRDANEFAYLRLLYHSRQ
jgi:hypothetical protein